jgi:hypothetical protein
MPFSDPERHREYMRERQRRLRGSVPRAERAATKAAEKAAKQAAELEAAARGEAIWNARRFEREPVKIARLMLSYKLASDRAAWRRDALAAYKTSRKSLPKGTELKAAADKWKHDKWDRFNELVHEVAPVFEKRQPEAWDKKSRGWNRSMGAFEARAFVETWLLPDDPPYPESNRGRSLLSWRFRLLKFVILAVECGGEIPDPLPHMPERNPARHTSGPAFTRLGSVDELSRFGYMTPNLRSLDCPFYNNRSDYTALAAEVLKAPHPHFTVDGSLNVIIEETSRADPSFACQLETESLKADGEAEREEERSEGSPA